MRYVIHKGSEMFKYSCPACGQVELLTGDEKTECPNCGVMMTQDPSYPFTRHGTPDLPPAKEEKTEVIPGPLYGQDEKGHITPMEPLIVKKKPGRPPKPKKGTCGSCATAMRAIKGYTCKIDCTAKREDDSCSLWIEGEPIG